MTLMVHELTLCVTLDQKGHVTSIRGYHGKSDIKTAADVRRIVIENPTPIKRGRNKHGTN